MAIKKMVNQISVLLDFNLMIGFSSRLKLVKEKILQHLKLFLNEIKRIYRIRPLSLLFFICILELAPKIGSELFKCPLISI